MSKFDFERIYDVIDLEKAKLNDNAFEKGIKSRPSSERGNKGNGVYIVPF